MIANLSLEVSQLREEIYGLRSDITETNATEQSCDEYCLFDHIDQIKELRSYHCDDLPSLPKGYKNISLWWADSFDVSFDDKYIVLGRISREIKNNRFNFWNIVERSSKGRSIN